MNWLSFGFLLWCQSNFCEGIALVSFQNFVTEEMAELIRIVSGKIDIILNRQKKTLHILGLLPNNNTIPLPSRLEDPEKFPNKYQIATMSVDQHGYESGRLRYWFLSIFWCTNCTSTWPPIKLLLLPGLYIKFLIDKFFLFPPHLSVMFVLFVYACTYSFIMHPARWICLKSNWKQSNSAMSSHSIFPRRSGKSHYDSHSPAARLKHCCSSEWLNCTI